ncbi:MAG TPA: hypothetical protein VFP39_09960 [Gemmatimonadales bacterium]|nr:hypothetical protein [Gemmatimonadales bacterium]
MRAVAIDLLWRQWRSLGAAATGRPVARQVDPEALILASLQCESEEPRLWTVMVDWLRSSARLSSVQRLKNLVGQFAGARELLPRLAASVTRESGDLRWRSLTRKGRNKDSPDPIRERAAGPTLESAPALMLRLRAAFGVGVKADLLAFLLGQRFRVSVATAASALGHSKPTVFRALQDLLEARMIRTTLTTTAAEYWIEAPPWEPLLGGAISRWGYWREILSYICALVQLERSTRGSASPYARAVAARDLAAEHETDLVRTELIDQELAVPRSAEWPDWKVFYSRFADRLANRV